jgi:putative transposase
VQTCVVHLVRGSLRCASMKHWSTITHQMRVICTAATVPAAEAAFGEFAEAWRGTYPAMIRSWEGELERVRAVSRVPDRAPQDRLYDQRHRVVELAVPTLGPPARSLPNEQPAMKILYLVAHQRRPGRSNLIDKTNGWKYMLTALTIHYGDRIAINH